MAGLTLILGITLMITSLRTPPDKNILSGITATIVITVLVLFALFTTWMVIRVPAVAAEMVGQAAGYVIILIFFIAVGSAMRKARLSAAKKKDLGS